MSRGQQFIQDGIYALGKPHMRSTPSLGSFPNVAFETVGLTDDGTYSSSQGRSLHEPFLFLRTPLSSFQAIDGVVFFGFVPAAGRVSSSSTLQIFRDASRRGQQPVVNRPGFPVPHPNRRA